MTDLDATKVADERDAMARMMEAYANLEPLTAVGPDAILAEAARRYELTENLHELETQGYTVVPPEKVASARFLDDLRDAVLRVYERRSGDEKVAERMNALQRSGIGAFMPCMLWEDEIFERALMNPVAQTLARAMCGHTARLSLFHGVVKKAGAGGGLPFHCDTEMTEPYPPVPQFCNVTYALSDYSEENGATMFVPGSHRLQRQPHTAEVAGNFVTSNAIAGGLHMPSAAAVECSAGSIIAWSGLTWHGATPSVDGERINILMYFARWYLQTQENYRDHIPPGALERNVPRFAQLMDVVPGWALKDPFYADAPEEAVKGRTIYPILDVPRP